MHALRRLGLVLVVPLVTLFLGSFVLMFGLFQVFDKPGPLQQTLRHSGIYNTFAERVIAQQAGTQASELALNNPEIRQAIAQAFPPSYVQQTLEQNIRVTYDWIHGTAKAPDYQIDLTQPKERFANNIAAVVEQKLFGLPMCTTATEPPTTPAEVLAMTCKPPFTPDLVIIELAREQALHSSIFEQNAVRIAELQDAQGRPFTDQFRDLPRARQYFIWVLWLLPTIIILGVLALLFLSSSRRSGAKRVAYILITVGILSIGLSFAAVWALDFAARFLIDQNSTLVTVQREVLAAVSALGSELRTWWFGVAIAYLVIGLVLLLWLRSKSSASLVKNAQLNDTLGYNQIPVAGTTFGPQKPKSGTKLTPEQRRGPKNEHRPR